MATTDWTQTTNTGLIGAPDVTKVTPEASGVIPATQAAQTTANVQTVAPTQTVSGQLDEMLKADSPYLQRAQSKSMEQANARGLLNSSMAAGAGTAAAIDAAAPIAQGNANLFADARNRNQDALNSTGQFNASESNKFGLTKAQQAFTAEQAGLDRAQQDAILGKQQTFSASQAGLDRAQQFDITGLQQNFTAAQSALDRAQQAYMADKTAANQMTLQEAQNNFAATQSAMDRAQQAYLQDDSQAHQNYLTQMQQFFTSSQSALDRQQQAYLQDDAQAFQTALNNTQIPANFALQISSSTMQGINAIAADPNLSGAVDGAAPTGSSPKSRAIQSALNYSNSQIAWANTFYSTNIPQMPLA